MSLPLGYKKETVQEGMEFICRVFDPAGAEIEELTSRGKNSIAAGSKVGMALKNFDFEQYEEEHDTSTPREEDPYKGLSGVHRLLAQSEDKGDVIDKFVGDWTVKLIPQSWASDLVAKVGKINYNFHIDPESKLVIFSNVNNRFGENYTDVHMPKIMDKINNIMEAITKYSAEAKKWYDGSTQQKQKSYMSGNGTIHSYKSESNNQVAIWKFMNHDIITIEKI